MISFFDYFYYRCFEYYNSKVNKKDGIPVFWSCSIVSICQTLNIVGIWMGYNLIRTGEIGITKYFSLSIAILLCIINLMRYIFFKNYTLMKDKWGNEPIETRKKKGKQILAYILISFPGMLLLIISLKSIIQY
jgi:hypothetical protein